MTNDNNYDYEAEMADMFKLFNPEDMTEWRKYSPEQFLGMIILEIRQQNVSIRGFSELLANIPEFRSQTFQINNQEIAATFFVDAILQASRKMDRLLDFMSAYKAEISKIDNS